MKKEEIQMVEEHIKYVTKRIEETEQQAKNIRDSIEELQRALEVNYENMNKLRSIRDFYLKIKDNPAITESEEQIIT